MTMFKSLAIFPWKESFQIGITRIVEQHKKIIDLLNVMVSHLVFQSDAPSIDKIETVYAGLAETLCRQARRYDNLPIQALIEYMQSTFGKTNPIGQNKASQV